MIKKIIGGIIRAFLSLLGIDEDKFYRFRLKKIRKRIIHDYLHFHTVKKLQIGTQGHSLPGWLNTDIAPKAPEVVFMDAREPFPLDDEVIDYIFTEHMIEHISFEEADFMLSECYRVMKAGARIRIATPNLESLQRLMDHPEDRECKQYMASYHTRYFPDDLPEEPVFTVNKLFYGFHHRFIHDPKSLKYLLEKNGFVDFSVESIGKSSCTELNGLEQHAAEIGEKNNQFETLVLEARKEDGKS